MKNEQRTAKRIAEELGVSDATLRTRWFRWILNVVSDEGLLKQERRFTPLALDLFRRYKIDCIDTGIDGKPRYPDKTVWVTEMRSEYAERIAEETPQPSEVVDGEVWEPEAPGRLELRTHTQLDRVSRRAELPPLPTLQIKDTRALKDDHAANLSYQSQASQALEQAITRLAQTEGEYLAATYKAEVSKQLAMGKLQTLQDLLGTQREGTQREVQTP